MGNHLAILRNPWFTLVMTGEKTIESRISQRKIVPYEKVKVNDWVYFKKSGAKLVGVKARIEQVLYFEGDRLDFFLNHYKEEIGIDEEYIKSKAKCNYLSLFWLGEVEFLGPKQFEWTQKAQKAWITNFEVPSE